MPSTPTVERESAELVMMIDADAEKIEITTAARIAHDFGEIASVDIGFNEPMGSLQQRYASQLVSRFNAHDDLVAALKDITICGLPDKSDGGYADAVKTIKRLTTIAADAIRKARA